MKLVKDTVKNQVNEKNVLDSILVVDNAGESNLADYGLEGNKVNTISLISIILLSLSDSLLIFFSMLFSLLKIFLIIEFI